MTGIYGNNKEDKHFENKLLNQEDDSNKEECDHCNNFYKPDDQEAKNYFQFCTDDCNEEFIKDLEFNEGMTQQIENYINELPNRFNNLKLLLLTHIIPLMKELNNQDIMDHEHLERIMEDFEDKKNEMNEIYKMSNDIIYYAEKIQRRTQD